jgi:hypothetical protein
MLVNVCLELFPRVHRNLVYQSVGSLFGGVVHYSPQDTQGVAQIRAALCPQWSPRFFL